MTSRERLIQQARNFLFVREVGANKGLWVGIFQRFVGIDPGESWCAAFVCFVLAIIVGGRDKLPIPCTGVVHEILTYAQEHEMTTSMPQPGDLFVFVNAEGHGHHIGIFTGFSQTSRQDVGIAGNTSEDGLSSNGTGVFEHGLNVAPNRVVFIRVFPA